MDKAEIKDTPVNQVKPDSGSAPEPKTTPVADGVIDPAPKPSTETERPPKGVETEFFKLRNDKRNLKSAVAERDAQIVEMKARLEALEKGGKSKTSEKSGIDTDKFFENPGEVLAETRKQATEDALTQFEERQEQAKLVASAELAKDWLLTRSHLKQDPTMVAEIRKALETRYAASADVNPMAAAEDAYAYVCRLKGIQPDFSNKASLPASHASSGIKSSSAGGSDPVITPETVKNFSREEVKKAVAEGRYKGKVIKL